MNIEDLKKLLNVKIYYKRDLNNEIIYIIHRNFNCYMDELEKICIFIQMLSENEEAYKIVYNNKDSWTFRLVDQYTLDGYLGN